MIRFAQLCKNIRPISGNVGKDLNVTGVVINSRQVEPGNVFVAIRGFEVDGHHFVDDAIRRGAGLLVVERDIGEKSVPVVRVENSRRAAAVLANRFFDEPSRGLRLIGITGTNGKSTVTFLLESILANAGIEVGLIGTLIYRWKGNEETAAHTTPDSIELFRLLRKMRDDGVQDVVMEVSSHALALDRALGLTFESAIFTNLSRDHLDFHSSFEDYGKCKAKLFSMLSPEGCGVVNGDDAAVEWMVGEARGRIVSYGEINKDVDYRIESIERTVGNTRFLMCKEDKKIPFETHLRGRFNVMNVAAAAITGLELGLAEEVVREGIYKIRNVRGRMETIDSMLGFQIVIDYAHTPGALKNVLMAVREFTEKRLIVVFGCGGDRDRGKRPEMGGFAADLADIIFVTSDNPRRENPETILKDILEGIDTEKKVITLVDRKEAMHGALDEAREGDVVVIAGKGHETYQEIGTERFPFNDRVVVETFLGLGKEG